MLTIEKFFPINAHSAVLIGWYVYKNENPIRGFLDPVGGEVPFTLVEYERPDLNNISEKQNDPSIKACGFIARITLKKMVMRNISILHLDGDKLNKRVLERSEFTGVKEVLDYLAWLAGESQEIFNFLTSNGLADIFRSYVLSIQDKLPVGDLISFGAKDDVYDNIVIINTTAENFYLLEAQISAYINLPNVAIYIGCVRRQNYSKLKEFIATAELYFPMPLYLSNTDALLRVKKIASVKGDKPNLNIYYNSPNVLPHANDVACLTSSKLTSVIVAKDLMDSPLSKNVKNKSNRALQQGIVKLNASVFNLIGSSVQHFINQWLTYEDIRHSLHTMKIESDVFVNGSTYNFLDSNLYLYPNGLESTENRYTKLLETV